MIIIYMINFHLIKKTGNWFKEKFDECWRKKKKEEYKLFNLNCEMKYWSMDTDRVYNNVFIIKFESVCFSIISYDLVCVCIERVINLKQNRDFILKWNFFCFLKFYFYTFRLLSRQFICLFVIKSMPITNTVRLEILATVCFIIFD